MPTLTPPLLIMSNQHESSETKFVTLDEIEQRLSEEHRKPYYEWTARIVTLASGALTLLVGLQNTYVAANPNNIWLLKSCWIGLMISILLGLMALYGESQTFLDAKNEIRRMRHDLGDDKASQEIARTRGKFPEKAMYRYARNCMSLSFALSFVALACFAVINSPHSQ
jgi:hypothetical protein